MRKILSIIFSLSLLSAAAQTGETRSLAAQHQDFVDDKMEKAAEYFEKEKWQAAKDQYDQVIKLQPYNLNAYYYRAYCNEKLLHYGLARADYETILQHQPKHFSSLIGLAVLNQKDRHFTAALDLANLLVENHPDSTLSWAVRANIEREQNRPALAEYDYKKAYQLSAAHEQKPSPQSRQYLLQAIDMMILQNKKREALKTLDSLVKSGTPRNSLLYYYNRAKTKHPH